VSLPALAGFSSIGDLYIPFALCGILDVLLVWILCKRWFDIRTASYASLWLTVSAAHVNFSRSALPPTPAIAFMLMGLLVISPKLNQDMAPSRRRLLICGSCFAVATAFHPAYLVFLVVPCMFLSITYWAERGRTSFLRKLFTDSAFVIVPTPILVLVHDAPSAMAHLLRGNFEKSDLLYLAGLWRLFQSPTIYSGVHEGFLFFPKYILFAEGAAGLVVTIGALAGVLLLWKRTEGQNHIYLVLGWLVVPYCWFSAWPSLNSYGRLYAPLLPALACLVGLGVPRIASAIQRLIPLPLAVVHSAFVILLSGVGFAATRPLVSTPGREPAVANYMREKEIKEVMAFVRTDEHVLAPVKVDLVFQPSEIERIRCWGVTNLILLSPGSMYLILRHREYLFGGLNLEPVFSYPNPYRIPVRLMEGNTPEERRWVLTQDRFARLGLFRVGPSAKGCQSTAN